MTHTRRQFLSLTARSVALTPDFGRPDYPGEQTFLLHCHNLEHEDQGMMLNVRVK